MARTFEIAALLLTIAVAGCRGPAGTAGPTRAPAPVDVEETRSPETRTQADSKASVSWVPVPVTEDSFDWIQLESGEWLKGKLKIMRDYELEFDSKKLDDQEFDWEDVLQVRTGRPFTVRLTDESLATGRLWVRDGRVYLDDDTEASFDREDIFSITPSGDRRLDLWDGKVSLGLSLSRGNTDETDITGTIDLTRNNFRSRLNIEYAAEYQEQDGDAFVDRQSQSTKLDLYVTERFYVTPLWLSLYTDEFQNIKLRATPAVGVGYQVYRDRRFDWDVSLAVGAQFVEYKSVGAGESSSDEMAAVLFGTAIDSDITKDLEWEFSYGIQVSIDDTQDTYQNTSTTLSFDLTDSIDLDISLIWRRVGQPTAESGGEVPDKDDLNFVIGFGIEF